MRPKFNFVCRNLVAFRNISKMILLSSFQRHLLFRRNIGLVKKQPKCEAVPHYTLALISFICINAECSKKTTQEEHELAIKQSDKFFSMGKFQDSLNALEPFKDSENVEVLWRLSRILYNMSLEKGIKSSDNAALINDAFQYIDKAIQLDQNHYAVHKWMAILYDAKSALGGIKSRIQALPIFKKHLMTAVELNPKDATSIYMLGQYMYNIADMSWLQKTIAKTLFGSPPEASFEEAFYYFNKAEEIEPNFYSANLLMLGKTCLKLQKIEAGCFWLKCAVAYPVRTDKDEAVRLEAEELLKKYSGVKQSAQEG